MKWILLGIIFLNFNVISQDKFPDYKEILLQDEQLNIPLIDSMLKMDHRVFEAAILGDWQVLNGRMNTTFPDAADNTNIEFEAWKKIVMTFGENGYFFLDGIIDMEGSWELQSNNTILYIKKNLGKRVDEEYQRIFIDEDIMHLILKEETAIVYMVLQKTEKKEFLDYFIENIQTIVKLYNTNICLYYECILKDVFHPQMADEELNKLLASIQKSISDGETILEIYELDDNLVDKITKAIELFNAEEELLNTLIAFNKNRSTELENDFKKRRSTVWKTISDFRD